MGRVALGVAGRVAEPGRIEERIIDLDAAVDDRDLDALAGILLAADQPAVPQFVRANLRDAGVHAQLVALFGVDIGHTGHGPQSLDRDTCGHAGERDRQAVEDDLIAALELCPRQRALDLRKYADLLLLQRGTVLLGSRAIEL